MKSTSTMNLKVDGHSPIPIRRQLTEQLRHAIEGGGIRRDQALPSIRELAGFLGVNPNTVARAIDDLKRSGYVEARRSEERRVGKECRSRGWRYEEKKDRGVMEGECSEVAEERLECGWCV